MRLKFKEPGYTIVGEYSDRLPEAKGLLLALDKDKITSEVQGSAKPDSIGDHLSLIKDFGQQRNRVLLIEYKGKKYVSKQFKRPKFLNGLIRRWIRGSKARKAYRNAEKLIENGFATATPVGWSERHKGLRTTDSWLVTDYLDHHLIAEFRDPYHTLLQKQALMKALSSYMLKLHSAGIYPMDFNIGNIFYRAIPEFHDQKNHTPIPEDIKEFYLIDINRMKFGKEPTFKQVMRSFDQLGILPEEYPYLLYPYIDARGWDREKSIDTILRYRNRNSYKKKLKSLQKACPYNPFRP